MAKKPSSDKPKMTKTEKVHFWKQKADKFSGRYETARKPEKKEVYGLKRDLYQGKAMALESQMKLKAIPKKPKKQKNK